jgi:ribosomal RNA-processing protein 17
MGPASKKRKIGSKAPAEITFDFAAREEYLTGFHKRKQARIKHAQEEAAKKEKEERLRMRREVGAAFSDWRVLACGNILF